MSSSVPDDIEQTLTDSYIVNLAGLSEQERRAAVAAIEELVRPLRMSVWVETNPFGKLVPGPARIPVNDTAPSGVSFDRI